MAASQQPLGFTPARSKTRNAQFLDEVKRTTPYCPPEGTLMADLQTND